MYLSLLMIRRFSDKVWTLEERRNRQDLIEVFQMHSGYSTVPLQELFVLDANSKGTRVIRVNLVKTQCNSTFFLIKL